MNKIGIKRKLKNKTGSSTATRTPLQAKNNFEKEKFIISEKVAFTFFSKNF